MTPHPVTPKHDPRPATAHVGVSSVHPGMQVLVGVAANAWATATPNGMRRTYTLPLGEAFMEMEYRQRPTEYNLLASQVERTVAMTVTSVHRQGHHVAVEACMPYLDGVVQRLVRARFALRRGHLVEVVH